MERQYTFYLNTTAVTTAQQFTVSNPLDDFRDRRIKHLYCGLQVSGLSVGLVVKGQLINLVDSTRFGNGNYPIDVDVTVPAKIQLVIQVTDLNGVARTNMPVVVGYEVAEGSGP